MRKFYIQCKFLNNDQIGKFKISEIDVPTRMQFTES